MPYACLFLIGISASALGDEKRWATPFQIQYLGQRVEVSVDSSSRPASGAQYYGSLLTGDSESVLLLTHNTVMTFDLKDVKSVFLDGPLIKIYDRHDSKYLAKLWEGSKTTLYQAVYWAVLNQDHAAATEAVKQLKKAKFDLNQGRFLTSEDSSGSLVCVAVEMADPQMITLLAREGADVNAPSCFWGDTPLNLAKEIESPETVQALIAAGASAK